MQQGFKWTDMIDVMEAVCRAQIILTFFSLSFSLFSTLFPTHTHHHPHFNSKSLFIMAIYVCHDTQNTPQPLEKQICLLESASMYIVQPSQLSTVRSVQTRVLLWR